MINKRKHLKLPRMTYMRQFNMGSDHIFNIEHIIFIHIMIMLLWIPTVKVFAQIPPELDKAIIDETNLFRAENGRPGLKENKKLMEIAQGHALKMALRDKYGDSGDSGHIMDGKSPKERIIEGGYDYICFRENVGFNIGYHNPVLRQIEEWKRSSSHRNNMLNEKFTEIGAAAVKGKSGRWYFVQLFGTPK